jgi:hypothetical protein
LNYQKGKINLNLQEDSKGLRTLSGNSNVFSKGKNEVIYVGTRKNALNKEIINNQSENESQCFLRGSISGL